jgi:hypothetical protein
VIEFQYFPGCPNAAETLYNLQQLIDEGVAHQVSFQGSPSILVDGLDLYTEAKPGGTHFACRTYIIDGRRTGVLPKDFIRRQLTKLRRSV